MSNSGETAGAFATSVAFHALIFAAATASLTLGTREDLIIEPQIIAIELVNIGTETVIKSAPPAPEVEAPPAPATLPTPPAPESEVETAPPVDEAPPPLPEPEPVVEPEPEKTPEPEPEPEPKKEPEPEPEPKELDFENLQSLIDRSKEPPKAQSEELENKLFAALDKPQAASAATDSREESLSLIDSARAQVQKCWKPPIGAKDAGQMRVSVTVQLAPDGNLIGAPKFDASDRRRMGRSDEAVFRVFAESAYRAVERCAPYALPRDRYAQWQSLRLNFDPSQMVY